jgi:hypothetical protein
MFVFWWVGEVEGGNQERNFIPNYPKGLGPKIFVENMFIHLPLEIIIFS